MMKRFLSAFLPPTLWMLFIFLLSSQPVLPGASIMWVDFLIKKTAHMFVYAVLFFLFYRGFNVISDHKRKTNWVMPLILTLSYAFSDEVHQSFVPGRTATLRDLGYDGLGAIIVLLRKRGFV